MRLTNAMRDAFVRGVMSGLPRQDYAEQIRRVIADDAVAQLPEPIRSLYVDGNTRDYVNQDYWNPVIGRLSSVFIPSKAKVRFQLTAKAQREVEDLDQKGLIQKRRDDDLRAKLHGVAHSCSTTAQLKEALPDFAQFVPSDPEKAIRSLPVLTGVADEFKQAGWKAT